MINKDAEFEQFITWFKDLKVIPLQTRHDFLAHLLEAGRFDEKSIEFMETTFSQLEAQALTRQEQWQNMIRATANAQAMQKLEEVSLTKKIARNVTAWMFDSAAAFKDKFKAKEAAVAEQQETAEQQTELNQVEALKAGLGA